MPAGNEEPVWPVGTWQSAVGAHPENLNHRACHEYRRHDGPGERAFGHVRPQWADGDRGDLNHRGQGREDEPDRGEMGVAAEQHRLGRRYPRQRVADDEPVPHLQPVTDARYRTSEAKKTVIFSLWPDHPAVMACGPAPSGPHRDAGSIRGKSSPSTTGLGSDGSSN